MGREARGGWGREGEGRVGREGREGEKGREGRIRYWWLLSCDCVARMKRKGGRELETFGGREREERRRRRR